MNPYMLLAGLLLWGASVVAAAWLGHGVGVDQAEAQAAREERLVAQAADAGASAAAGAISRISVRHQTIKQEVQRDVIERQVFTDCRSGDDAVRLFNATVPGAAASATSGRGQLPAKDPAD